MGMGFDVNWGWDWRFWMGDGNGGYARWEGKRSEWG